MKNQIEITINSSYSDNTAYWIAVIENINNSRVELSGKIINIDNNVSAMCYATLKSIQYCSKNLVSADISNTTINVKTSYTGIPNWINGRWKANIPTVVRTVYFIRKLQNSGWDIKGIALSKSSSLPSYKLTQRLIRKVKHQKDIEIKDFKKQNDEDNKYRSLSKVEMAIYKNNIKEALNYTNAKSKKQLDSHTSQYTVDYLENKLKNLQKNKKQKLNNKNG